jgi:hypothetical protein
MWIGPAVLAAAAVLGGTVVLGGTARAALACASDKNPLVEGEWEGEDEWQEAGTGGGDEPGAKTPEDPEPAPATGTPTEPTGSGEEPIPGTTAPGDEPTGTGDSGGEPTGQDPGAPTSGGPGPMQQVLASCPARWTVEVDGPLPMLYDKETLLTLVIFRTDAFGFICNAYARSISTWYVDWFTTSAADHGDRTLFKVTLRLTGRCPNCNPSIQLEGISALETKALVMTDWGGVDASTWASSTAGTAWAGPLDCTDSCSASSKSECANSKYGVDVGVAKASNTETKAYTLAVAFGGKADTEQLQESEARVTIVNYANVSSYAGGTEDTAAAKARAGYCLRMRGVSSCGPWGEYEIDLKSK